MNLPTDPEQYLQPGPFIDSDHPAVTRLAGSLIDPAAGDLENAVTLYYWVRDNIRYNPYLVARSRESLMAHTTVEAGEGWCVPKAILLAALCRASGIPARLGFADVVNHLSTKRLRETMQTEVFYFHGYTSLYLNRRWVKATPAFNIQLCEKFGLRPLEFNGRQDSLYHEFDMAGNRHMEYLNDRGEYLDLPFDELMATFREHYPNMVADEATDPAAVPDANQWHEDVDREVGLS